MRGSGEVANDHDATIVLFRRAGRRTSRTADDHPAAAPPGRAAHDPYAALRLADYRRFLLAGIVSTIGGQMQGVAVGWELYERTGSATALGLVGLAQVLPVLLLALPAGHAADRVQPQATSSSSPRASWPLASLGPGRALVRHGPIGLVYVCLLLTGIGQAVNMPARWAILPQLVPARAAAATR